MSICQPMQDALTHLDASPTPQVRCSPCTQTPVYAGQQFGFATVTIVSIQHGITKYSFPFRLKTSIRLTILSCLSCFGRYTIAHSQVDCETQNDPVKCAPSEFLLLSGRFCALAHLRLIPMRLQRVVSKNLGQGMDLLSP